MSGAAARKTGAAQKRVEDLVQSSSGITATMHCTTMNTTSTASCSHIYMLGQALDGLIATLLSMQSLRKFPLHVTSVKLITYKKVPQGVA